MQKLLVIFSSLFAGSVHAHSLAFLPNGLAHELLHIAPGILLALAALFVIRRWLMK